MTRARGREGEWGRAESRKRGACFAPQKNPRAKQDETQVRVRVIMLTTVLYYLASQYPTTNSVHVQTTQASTIVSLDRLRLMEFTTL